MKTLPSYRVIETQINRETLESIVAVWLNSVNVINDDEHVTTIEFGDLTAELVPIKIHIKKPEVKLIRHD